MNVRILAVILAALALVLSWFSYFRATRDVVAESSQERAREQAESRSSSSGEAELSPGRVLPSALARRSPAQLFPHALERSKSRILERCNEWEEENSRIVWDSRETESPGPVSIVRFVPLMDEATRNEFEATFYSLIEDEVGELSEKNKKEALAVAESSFFGRSSARMLVFSTGDEVEGSGYSVAIFEVGSEPSFGVDDETGSFTIESDSVSFISDPGEQARQRYAHLFRDEES